MSGHGNPLCIGIRSSFDARGPTEVRSDEIGVTAALRHRGIGRRLLDEMLALGKAWAAARPGSAAFISYVVRNGRTQAKQSNRVPCRGDAVF
jgi:hypothetical protein